MRSASRADAEFTPSFSAPAMLCAASVTSAHSPCSPRQSTVNMAGHKLELDLELMKYERQMTC